MGNSKLFFLAVSGDCFLTAAVDDVENRGATGRFTSATILYSHFSLILLILVKKAIPQPIPKMPSIPSQKPACNILLSFGRKLRVFAGSVAIDRVLLLPTIKKFILII